MTQDDSETRITSSLLLDSRSRALIRRTDPFEVRGAYEWARRASGHPRLHGIAETKLVGFAPLAALVREEIDLPIGTAMKMANINERHVRRLLASTRDDIKDQLTKIIRLLKRKADIADVIATAAYWGEKTSRQVAEDYFGIDRNAPSDL
ncbi:MAG: hypothetical protein NTY41_08945 [Proteobacteria bacterium]|nr:hypothetical protein [Pseudomonadota bacterium]